MKIGVISDTHDAHKAVIKAIEIFNDKDVEYVFHAGDMVSPFTAKAFSMLERAKFIAVFGNCDGEKILIKSSIEQYGGVLYPHSFSGEIGGRKIFMTHIPDTLEEVVCSGKYDLVIYGHTHKQDIQHFGNTLVLNPGETTDWITGVSRIVIAELDDMTCESILL